VALEMQRATQDMPGIKLRIGIDIGSVVAGPIGRRKFGYDPAGDGTQGRTTTPLERAATSSDTQELPACN